MDIDDGLVRIVDENRVPTHVLARAAGEVLERYDSVAGPRGAGRYSLWRGIHHGQSFRDLLITAGVSREETGGSQDYDVHDLFEASSLDRYLDP